MTQKIWFKKKSPLHGSGLFAKTNIKKGQKVIQYIGDKVTKREGDKRADKQIRKAKKDKKDDTLSFSVILKFVSVAGKSNIAEAKIAGITPAVFIFNGR